MKTLIVFFGNPGEIVRTTVLLDVIKGNIFGLVKFHNTPILKSKRLKAVFIFENPIHMETLTKYKFDLVVSLNEEPEALNVSSYINAERFVGIHQTQKNVIEYSRDSKYWFDMTLMSKRGKEVAKKLKLMNRKSIPQILVEMVGSKWKGCKYDIGQSPLPYEKVEGKIGIIDIVKNKWPNKMWGKYNKLAKILTEDKYEVNFFRLRPSISDHIEDINKCELIVCGDTFGMHIGLALCKNVVALFNCTSPYEIYNDPKLEKVVSPLYETFFYKRKYSEKAVNAITLETVLEAINKSVKSELSAFKDTVLQNIERNRLAPTMNYII